MAGGYGGRCMLCVVRVYDRWRRRPGNCLRQGRQADGRHRCALQPQGWAARYLAYLGSQPYRRTARTLTRTLTMRGRRQHPLRAQEPCGHVRVRGVQSSARIPVRSVRSRGLVCSCPAATTLDTLARTPRPAAEMAWSPLSATRANTANTGVSWRYIHVCPRYSHVCAQPCTSAGSSLPCACVNMQHAVRPLLPRLHSLTLPAA